MRQTQRLTVQRVHVAQTSGALCLTYHGNRMLLYTSLFESRVLLLHLSATLVGTILVVMRSY